MLFWIFVIVLVIGIICVILGNKIFDVEWIKDTGWIIIIAAAIGILVSAMLMACCYATAEAEVAKNCVRYDSLVYQLENNLYDNDNDVGKKELYKEIREWNEDLAYFQNIQDNFWFGIFYPNVYDQFNFIEFE